MYPAADRGSLPAEVPTRGLIQSRPRGGICVTNRFYNMGLDWVIVNRIAWKKVTRSAGRGAVRLFRSSPARSLALKGFAFVG